MRPCAHLVDQPAQQPRQGVHSVPEGAQIEREATRSARQCVCAACGACLRGSALGLEAMGALQACTSKGVSKWRAVRRSSAHNQRARGTRDRIASLSSRRGSDRRRRAEFAKGHGRMLMAVLPVDFATARSSPSS